MSGRDGSAVPAGRASQGVAGVAPASRPLARRAGGAARRALPPPPHVGNVDRQSRPRRHDRRNPAATALGWRKGHALRRAEPGEATVGHARGFAAALRHRRPRAERSRGGSGGGFGRPHFDSRRHPRAATERTGRRTRKTLARARRTYAGAGDRPRHARPLRRALGPGGEYYMIRNMTMAALAVCLLWPVASVTQESPRARTRPRVRVETRNGPYGVYSFNDNRWRFGVIVDTRANAAGDKVGARIDGVTPSGPA